VTDTGDHPARRAIVLADGAAPDRGALDASWPGWADGRDLVVAADGGARLAKPLGLAIDRWVGDGDSLGPAEVEALRASGIPIVVAARDKDESDTELAVLAAIEAGADDLAIVGALGGPRFDHALANIGLLAHPALRGRTARLVAPDARVTLVEGPAAVALHGRAGDLVSLLPYGDRVAGVTTEGLRYPLRDEPLESGPARGLSNVRSASVARISLRAGRLLIVETPATLST
jgi:thiamine pyrophosphokinase